LGADLAFGGAERAPEPDSERRSSTLMIMMFATPTAPTISATAPRPRNRLFSALFA
jgi:hypothetical protein